VSEVICGHAVELAQTPKGGWWLPAGVSRDTVAGCVREGRLYDRAVAEALEPYIRPGTVVVDLGCCYGQMAVHFAGLVGPAGRVVAVEASPFNAALARRNFALHGAGRIVLHQKAAFSLGGLRLCVRHDVVRDGTFACGWVAPAAAVAEWAVETMALDDLDLPGAVSALKVDVQGCDLPALMGGSRLLRRDRPAVVFEWEPELAAAWTLDWADVEWFLGDAGYRIAGEIHADGRNFLILPD
jgi:FkbM family methyltransferase